MCSSRYASFSREYLGLWQQTPGHANTRIPFANEWQNSRSHRSKEHWTWAWASGNLLMVFFFFFMNNINRYQVGDCFFWKLLTSYGLHALIELPNGLFGIATSLWFLVFISGIIETEARNLFSHLFWFLIFWKCFPKYLIKVKALRSSFLFFSLMVVGWGWNGNHSLPPLPLPCLPPPPPLPLLADTAGHLPPPMSASCHHHLLASCCHHHHCHNQSN